MSRTGIAPMFANVQAAPPDAILGLTDAFKADPNPAKINLGVGVYKDEAGQTPVLKSVKEAEQRLLAGQKTKNYLPIGGDPGYRAAVRQLLFGQDHELATSRRVETAHTPGGTGALRVAADYLSNNHRGLTVWLSDPTWANHPAIFEAAGLPTRVYPYYDPATFGLKFDAMMDVLGAANSGDAVLLHGCCHNPTGVDLTAEQWRQVAQLCAERGLLPIVDLAYQGFADGLEEDALSVRTVAALCGELLICSSYSKNFSLYNERVGALTVVAADEAAAAAVFSNIEVAIRRNYSNPPAHGAAIVQTIVADAGLTATWHGELAAMRDRIHAMRKLFAAGLDAHGVRLGPKGNDFVITQRGMFSFSGLTKDQVARLRSEYAIYMVGSGRINVAGVSPANCERLCAAIAAVTGR